MSDSTAPPTEMLKQANQHEARANSLRDEAVKSIRSQITDQLDSECDIEVSIESQSSFEIKILPLEIKTLDFSGFSESTIGTEPVRISIDSEHSSTPTSNGSIEVPDIESLDSKQSPRSSSSESEETIKLNPPTSGSSQNAPSTSDKNSSSQASNVSATTGSNKEEGMKKKSQFNNIQEVVEYVDERAENESGAPIDKVLSCAAVSGFEEEKAKRALEKLRTDGKVEEPRSGYITIT